MKKLLSGILLAVTSLVLVACSGGNSASTSGDNWKKYEETKSIKIGFDNTFVPMGFEDENGKTVGFDIDLAEAVFAKYGIKVTWQPINWELKEEELNNGNIDLIWNGYTMTEERAKKVQFTNPYMVSGDVLVVKKSSGIKSPADMKDKNLGAQSGSSGYDAFNKKPEILKDSVKNNDAVLYDTFNQAFIDLETSRIDALLVDNVYATYYLTKNGKAADYDVVPVELERGDFGVGARKADTQLVAKINEAFTTLYKEGKYQEISKKWFGNDTATKEVKGN
ncbi:MAG: amino acid ABC transporter substrate-binding protein [Gemella sp.]|nr:amino acid ABC transporter substrate-binding protein [Gemella sp.]